MDVACATANVAVLVPAASDGSRAEEWFFKSAFSEARCGRLLSSSVSDEACLLLITLGVMLAPAVVAKGDLVPVLTERSGDEFAEFVEMSVEPARAG